METLFFLGLAIAIGCCTFRHGKRLGSRLAYRVGRRHGRPLRPKRRLRSDFLSHYFKRRF